MEEGPTRRCGSTACTWRIWSTSEPEKLKAANEKLKELDQLKSMFIASMSHELRTPLNSIIGFTGMTIQGLSGELNDEQKDNLPGPTSRPSICSP